MQRKIVIVHIKKYNFIFMNDNDVYDIDKYIKNVQKININFVQKPYRLVLI